MNKIIFLDIDGVICTMRVKFSGFDKKCLFWIDMILKITNAKIVISSAWRRPYFEHTKDLLIKNGFTQKYIDRIIGQTDHYNSCRGWEIKKWLDENDKNANYVILDDSTDMLFQQRNNFVNTSAAFGLSLFSFIKCLWIFYKPQKYNWRSKLQYWQQRKAINKYYKIETAKQTT